MKEVDIFFYIFGPILIYLSSLYIFYLLEYLFLSMKEFFGLIPFMKKKKKENK